MQLGSTIKRCRTVRAFTLDELAVETGLSKGYLSLVESDQREPSLTAVDSIATALDVPIEVLVLMAARSEQLDDVDEKHLRRLKSAVWKLVTPREH